MRIALALGIAILAAGCSAIVSLSDDDIRCVGEGASDPCPEGRQCRDGFCVLITTPDSGPPDATVDGCVPDERGELCNGIDDNCNGEIDEGHDEDGDRFTWCGGGVANQADCDDNDPNSHPGNAVVDAADEVCDGADNDCDGMIDEDDGSGVLCPAGLQCIDRVCGDPDDCSLESVDCEAGERCDFEMTPPRCVPGGCTDASCAPLRCNMETGTCVTPAAVGEDCFTDEDCAEPAICVLKEALGLGSGRICTEPCCADGQCGAGNVCHASGTGAELCVPADMVGANLGGGAGGDACTGDGQCASGVCLGADGCLGNCATDADCSSGLACAAVVSGMSSVQFSCAAPGGPVENQDFDYFDEGCSSRLYGGRVCAGPCIYLCVGSCGTTDDCSTALSSVDFYCGFGEAADYDSVFPSCTVKRHSGGGEDGASCSTNAGCRDLACVMDQCADTCCDDSDCTGSRRCRPIQIRSQWEMHCI
jgi:hypothetical protein